MGRRGRSCRAFSSGQWLRPSRAEDVPSVRVLALAAVLLLLGTSGAAVPRRKGTSSAGMAERRATLEEQHNTTSYSTCEKAS
jgi:hypothetical protein